MNNSHPLLELLEVTSHDVFLKPYNYNFFLQLKEALARDGKGTFLKHESSTVLNKPINSAVDLYQNQSEALLAIIASWSVSVMTPLVKNLNLIGGDEKIHIYFDGDLTTGMLYFNNFELYVAQMDDEQREAAGRILNGYGNSKQLIGNVAELEELLEEDDEADD